MEDGFLSLRKKTCDRWHRYAATHPVAARRRLPPGAQPELLLPRVVTTHQMARRTSLVPAWRDLGLLVVPVGRLQPCLKLTCAQPDQTPRRRPPPRRHLMGPMHTPRAGTKCRNAKAEPLRRPWGQGSRRPRARPASTVATSSTFPRMSRRSLPNRSTKAFPSQRDCGAKLKR